MSPRGEKRQYISAVTHRGRVLRDSRFDNARGILIILVVIGHFLMPLYQTRFITGIYYAIYIFHMPCFLFISGYYAKSLYRDGKYRWGKVAELLWLYFLYECTVNITEGLLAGYIPLIPDFFHESGAPWYLLVVALYYCLIPLFHRVTAGRQKLLIVLGLTVGISFAKYILQLGDIFAFDRFLAFMPFFVAGYYTSQPITDKYLLWRYKRVVEIAAAVCIGIIFLGAYDLFGSVRLIVFGADYHRYADSLQPWLWLVSISWYLVAFTISIGFIGAMLSRQVDVITYLGRNTLQVYFLHRPIRDILEYCGVFALVNPHSKLSVIVYICVVAMLAVLLGTPPVSWVFGRVRTAFDSVLEKYGGL